MSGLQFILAEAIMCKFKGPEKILIFHVRRRKSCRIFRNGEWSYRAAVNLSFHFLVFQDAWHGRAVSLLRMDQGE